MYWLAELTVLWAAKQNEMFWLWIAEIIWLQLKSIPLSCIASLLFILTKNIFFFVWLPPTTSLRIIFMTKMCETPKTNKHNKIKINKTSSVEVNPINSECYRWGCWLMFGVANGLFKTFDTLMCDFYFFACFGWHIMNWPIYNKMTHIFTIFGIIHFQLSLPLFLSRKSRSRYLSRSKVFQNTA